MTMSTFHDVDSCEGHIKSDEIITEVSNMSIAVKARAALTQDDDDAQDSTSSSEGEDDDDFEDPALHKLSFNPTNNASNEIRSRNSKYEMNMALLSSKEGKTRPKINSQIGATKTDEAASELANSLTGKKIRHINSKHETCKALDVPYTEAPASSELAVNSLLLEENSLAQGKSLHCNSKNEINVALMMRSTEPPHSNTAKKLLLMEESQHSKS